MLNCAYKKLITNQDKTMQELFDIMSKFVELWKTILG